MAKPSAGSNENNQSASRPAKVRAGGGFEEPREREILAQLKKSADSELSARVLRR